MSPLVITSAVESSIPVIGEEEDKQKAVLMPATRRRFARSDQLLVLAAVYAKHHPDQAPPVIEIATALKATDQQSVFNRTEERGGDELKKAGTRLSHISEIPLERLAPGEYLLETTARNRATKQEVSRRVLIEVF